MTLIYLKSNHKMAALLRPVCIFIVTDSNKRRSSIPDPGIEMETLVPETDPKKQKHKKRLKSLYKEIIDQVIKGLKDIIDRVNKQI